MVTSGVYLDIDRFAAGGADRWAGGGGDVTKIDADLFAGQAWNGQGYRIGAGERRPVIVPLPGRGSGTYGINGRGDLENLRQRNIQVL